MKVLLYSGGVDSVCLAHIWQPDQLLFIDYGGRYTATEMAHLPPGTHVYHHRLGGWERDDGVLPLRNLWLVSLATLLYQEGDLTVALGSMRGDRIHDNQPRFGQQLEHLLDYLWAPQWWTEGRRIRVEQPVSGMSKDEVVKLYLDAGGSEQKLLDTISCYRPVSGQPCGGCEACANRWVALAANGVASEPDMRAYVEANQLPRMSAEAVLAALGRPLPAEPHKLRTA